MVTIFYNVRKQAIYSGVLRCRWVGGLIASESCSLLWKKATRTQMV